MSGSVLILGSGTSTGVPTIGKDYAPEFLAEPKNHRLRSSIVIHGPTGNLLVDCTPDMRTQLLRFGIKDIEAVLITHTHADHVMGMDDLRAFCLKYQGEVPVFARPEHIPVIKNLFPYMFMDWPPEILVPRIDLQVTPGILNVGGLEIETLEVDHGSTNVTALRINDVAYVTDVKRIPPAAMERLYGLDTLILDAVRYKPHPNHLNYEEAVAMVDVLRPKRTFFTHLSDDFDHHFSEAKMPPHIRLAYDGQLIEV